MTMNVADEDAGRRRIHDFPPWKREGRDAAPAIEPLAFADIDVVLRYAIDEDRGPGDLTTEVAVSPDRRALGKLVAKGEGVIAGLDVFGRVFELLDEHVKIMKLVRDGERVAPGDELVKVVGSAQGLLIGERTALNFVQRMSGIATQTARFVERAGGRARLLDTRKTTPGLRQFEKYAVRCGGAENHRFGLFDEVMVKNNHIDLSGTELVGLLFALRATHGNDVVIHAEARDEREALDAVAGGADVVLLDNMSVAEMSALVPRLRDAAREAGREVEIEASGTVTLQNVAEIAGCGVDRVSIGALTHSAPVLDLSFPMEILP